MVLPLPSTTRGSGLRIVTAHGFTQTRDLWGRFGDGLAARFEVTNCDLPGHGTAADVICDLEEAGARLFAAAHGEQFVALGYSLGGRTALMGALQHPANVRALILIAAHPGLDDPNERLARRISDEALARQLRRDDDVDAFIDRWLDRPLFAGLAPDPTARAIRCTNTAQGLASSLETMGLGTQPPCLDALAHLTMPVLLITGANDAKFTGLARTMAARLPFGRHVEIAGASHPCHLIDPAATLLAIESFLDQLG